MLPFSNIYFTFLAAALLRIVLFFYGLWQDAYSPIKYTDIDYFVFTDAARFVSRNLSPYDRDTYRYTPLLAWFLLPATWSKLWFSWGKAVFATGDIIAGWLILLVLRFSSGMSKERALKLASIWLLNPMVAVISTRGSSEGLLGVMVVALLWAVTRKKIKLAGILLGLAVHFKIYPFIYAISILWWLDQDRVGDSSPQSTNTETTISGNIIKFFNPARRTLAITSFSTFAALNLLMFSIYGRPFVQHTYLHHVTRIDHRHNFSPYNTLLYLSSSPSGDSVLRLESIAFIPQLFLSAIAIPLALAKKDLASTLLAQTFAFVTFNKVCTSQYFLWYIVLLPFYIPKSSFVARPAMGICAAFSWVLGQAWWLQQGYRLEFLGESTFVPGLWLSSIFFFLMNVWILGTIVTDVSQSAARNIWKKVP
ncbi:GPI mannosyltransferase 1 [Glutinoglossum americanum]|uniref:GPI mannosyltransferase 1 n=1 Tax=Glutinoglossum americanum TaxID=1670608 RepID=A0A9P8I4K7_9PEZI|nr:GPI mannosyltransferase 1 [Glutinoglossum americanum]